ncbi:MAG: cupin domain-containing protein [Lachnospiraceae bacterium]|nr:cupin domain-containing protein [Lachnospiraceae bacterium]
MEYYIDGNKVLEQMHAQGRHACDVLTAEQGCVNGCKAGYTFYADTEYHKGGVHEDQEGFLVLEGTGMAKFDDEEFAVYPGMMMVAPAGVRHTIRRDPDSVPVKVFWFHSAV